MPLLTIELLITAALWGWWAWKDPKRAFLGLPILLPTYLVRTSLGPIPTTALELIILATCAAWMIKRGQDGLRDACSVLRTWRIPAYLWLTAGFVAVLVSPVTLQALGLFRAYFIEPLLVFVIGADLVRTREDRRRLAQSFATVTILLAVWAVIQYATGWGIPKPWDAWPGRRATGPFPFPNALALFVTPIAALALADVVARYNDRSAGAHGAPLLKSIIGWLTVIAGFVAVILAQSDGGLVALLAATFVALLLHRQTRKAALTVALAAILAVAVIQPLRSAVEEKLLFKEWSGKVRTVIWKESWTMLTDTGTPAGLARPILGAGLAAYPTAILPYHKATWMEVFQYPHNILLNIWSETGLLGLIAFSCILITWVRRGSGPRTTDLILPILTALLVHGLVDVPYFKNDLAVAFWLFVLITTSLKDAPNRIDAKDKSPYHPPA